MKKFLIALTLFCGITLAACARDSYSHDASVLPEPAQTTLTKNFKAEVSVIKIDREMGRIDDYEVILTDGTEVKFKPDGQWVSVETSRAGAVPAYFILPEISKFVAQKHEGTKIIGIERERNRFDVELSNGIDILFDKKGNFLRYDD